MCTHNIFTPTGRKNSHFILLFMHRKAPSRVSVYVQQYVQRMQSKIDIACLATKNNLHNQLTKHERGQSPILQLQQFSAGIH